MLRATVDKTRISYQTILSFYRTYSSSPSLLPSLSVDRMLITGATHLSLRQPTQSKADAQKPSHFSGDRPSCHITTTYLNRPSVNQQLCLRHTNARARMHMHDKTESTEIPFASMRVYSFITNDFHSFTSQAIPVSMLRADETLHKKMSL